MSLSEIATPDFKDTPYWWEAAPPDLEGDAPPPEEVDVAVIGSGYTGMSAALELAREGLRVLVMDAERFGEGASTRSGGMVSGGVNVGKGGDSEQRYGKDRVEAMIEEAGESYAHFEQLIAREGIDCHYARTGRFVGAHTPSAHRAQALKVAALNDHADAGAAIVARADQKGHVNTNYYHGGMTVDRSGGVHPALYHKGLRQACLRAGVILSGNCRVHKVDGSAGDLTLRTSRGVVQAREVVLGTNGYTGREMPWHHRRVIPIASYIIATEPLGEERIRELFPDLRMIADTKRVLYYFRPSPDGTRVIFGGRASFRSRTAVETAPVLYKYMLGIFPQLAGVKISHGWTGNVAFTFDRVPHMGTIDGVHYALGCNGSGVVMMSHLGHQTARKILGKANRPSAFEGLPFPTNPLYTGTPWFLPTVGAWYQIRDRIDRMMAPA
jgi:glycine/D-amino acid oxidase-like deaminating enzyme